MIDFGLGAPVPSTVTAQQGGASNTTSFQVTGLGAFASTVTLVCQGAVITAGATCNFLPSATVNPTSRSPIDESLTISVPANIAVSNYNVTIKASSAGTPASKTRNLTLVVIAPVPDFAVGITASPASVLAKQTVTWNGTLTAVNGYNQSVALSCGTGKPGTCTLNPTSLVPTANGVPFTVTVGDANTGVFNFAIQGTDGTTTHASPVTLSVNTDVEVPRTLSDASVHPGQKAATTLDVSPVGGVTFSGAVGFSCLGQPAGLQCVFEPSQINVGEVATSVNVSIQTVGPFTGTQRRLRTRNQRLWLPLSLPLAGMVLVGMAGRDWKRRVGVIGLTMVTVLSVLMLGCGGIGGGGGGPPPPPPPVSVTVSPLSVNTLYPSLNGAPPQTQQFTATVHNSTNQSVTWAVGGGAANGAIDANGLYTAPGAVPAGAITVTAAATADSTKSGSATVNIQTPTSSGTSLITVTVTEATQPQARHTATFNLTVQ